MPHYAMMAEGGGDHFKPLLRWYLGILPLAKRSTALWFKETDAAGTAFIYRKLNVTCAVYRRQG